MKFISPFPVLVISLIPIYLSSVVHSRSGVERSLDQIKKSEIDLNHLSVSVETNLNNKSTTIQISEQTQKVISNATLTSTKATFKPTTTSSPVTINCPEKCSCYPDGLVDCTKAGKTQIPSINELPVNVKILDLTSNLIRRLSRFDTMFNLTKLVLRSNAIEVVEPKVFQSVPNLKELDLSFNNLSRMPANLLAPLHSLQILKLTTCNISKLDANFFEQNVHLTHLYLDSNPLFKLANEDDEFLKNLKSLEYLNLANTKLIEFKINRRTELKKLKTLILSNNELDLVPIFKYAPNIETLILDYNRIIGLNQQSFQYLWNLQNLHLSHNDQLLDIEELTFARQTNLKTLVLSNNNNLFMISHHAFYGMYNQTHFPLKVLNLQKNSLHYLSENLLENKWASLDVLDLRLNPWNCDCHLQWLHKYKTNRNVTELRCKSPEMHRAKRLVEIDANLMVCQKLMDTMVYNKLKNVFQGFVFILIFFVFLLALTLVYIIRDRKYDLMRLFGANSTSTIYYQKANTKEHSILY